MKNDYPEVREMARKMTDVELKQAQELHRSCRKNKIGHDRDAERIVNDEIKRRKHI